jgi:hypothetical protein
MLSGLPANRIKQVFVSPESIESVPRPSPKSDTAEPATAGNALHHGSAAALPHDTLHFRRNVLSRLRSRMRTHPDERSPRNATRGHSASHELFGGDSTVFLSKDTEEATADDADEPLN